MSGALLTGALFTEIICYQITSYLWCVGRPCATLPLTHAYISFAPAAQLLMCTADMAVQLSNLIHSPCQDFLAEHYLNFEDMLRGQQETIDKESVVPLYVL